MTARHRANLEQPECSVNVKIRAKTPNNSHYVNVSGIYFYPLFFASLAPPALRLHGIGKPSILPPATQTFIFYVFDIYITVVAKII